MDWTTDQRRKIHSRMSFPTYLNMNHFLDESTQSDFSKTEALIAENLMSTLTPTSWSKPAAKPKPMSVADVADQPLQASSKDFASKIESEFGDFAADEGASSQPKLSEKAMQRKLEKERQAREHRERMKKMRENGAVKKPSRL